MDLQTLANLAQIIGVVAVIAAVVFGLLQARQFRVQRRDAAAAELVRSFQDVQFTRAYTLISTLPINASASEFHAAGQAVEDAALFLGMRYELIGLLVFRGIMPLSLVAQSTGAVVLTLWSKMQAWVVEKREREVLPHFMEWFQWLIEQLEKRGRREEEPAFIKHRGWTPPRE